MYSNINELVDYNGNKIKIDFTFTNNEDWILKINDVEEMRSAYHREYLLGIDHLLKKCNSKKDILIVGGGDLQIASHLNMKYDNDIFLTDPIGKFFTRNITPMSEYNRGVIIFEKTFEDFSNMEIESFTFNCFDYSYVSTIIFDVSDISDNADTLEKEIYGDSFSDSFYRTISNLRTTEELKIITYNGENQLDSSSFYPLFSKPCFREEEVINNPYGTFSLISYNA